MGDPGRPTDHEQVAALVCGGIGSPGCGRAPKALVVAGLAAAARFDISAAHLRVFTVVQLTAYTPLQLDQDGELLIGRPLRGFGIGQGSCTWRRLGEGVVAGSCSVEDALADPAA